MPDTPKWDQFIEWNQKLIKKDASGKIVRIGTNPDAWGFGQFAGVLGFSYYSADKTKLAVNSPESVAALAKWVALLPADVPYDDISNLLAGAPTNTYGTFGAGLAGIIWDGFWGVPGPRQVLAQYGLWDDQVSNSQRHQRGVEAVHGVGLGSDHPQGLQASR